MGRKKRKINGTRRNGMLRISSSLGEIVAMHADRDKREVGMSSKAASQPTRGAECDSRASEHYLPILQHCSTHWCPAAGVQPESEPSDADSAQHTPSLVQGAAPAGGSPLPPSQPVAPAQAAVSTQPGAASTVVQDPAVASPAVAGPATTPMQTQQAQAKNVTVEQASTTPQSSSTAAPTGVQQQDSNEEKRVHPRDKDNMAYSYADFLKFFGETGFDQVLASLVLASQPYFKDAAVDF